ncbi:hypothetical protein LOK49_LG06G02432 [Camellia lanceoleosa]|uniref:Uncharacterized protein n=1 Tax=Camellia lanceoleosa TaxID=1840588 RepID=A0ACC0HA48_9ERIC|nr:hypothetical protein LOK49_LG06G02432 [Camellia lanceoleosa]
MSKSGALDLATSIGGKIEKKEILSATLLAFVNFKLYHSINVKYPPILDPRLEALAADLYALSRYLDANSKGPALESQAASSSGSEQAEAQENGTELEESELRLAQLQHQLPSNEPGALMHLVEDAPDKDEDDEETKECKTLLKNMKFFLSREVPRESLLFAIPAFGGVVTWEGEGSPFNESDQSITHQYPMIHAAVICCLEVLLTGQHGHRFLSREYVQPQWVYDCVNARIILPLEDYLWGRQWHGSKFHSYSPAVVTGKLIVYNHHFGEDD